MLALSAVAQAQPYPNRAVKFIVPFPPGGNLDFVARTVQPKLAEFLGQPVVIENKGGAAGILGAEYAARQPADGYTIFLGNTGTIGLNPSTYAKLPYDRANIKAE
jgi:tripartite-type tricarboxylate transporter receptor subunit TctC